MDYSMGSQGRVDLTGLSQELVDLTSASQGASAPPGLRHQPNVEVTSAASAPVIQNCGFCGLGLSSDVCKCVICKQSFHCACGVAYSVSRNTGAYYCPNCRQPTNYQSINGPVYVDTTPIELEFGKSNSLKRDIKYLKSI
jgi:hypothetical protein